MGTDVGLAGPQLCHPGGDRLHFGGHVRRVVGDQEMGIQCAGAADHEDADPELCGEVQHRAGSVDQELP
ncbi:hypothetical protein [Streptomyces olivaceoviridis]|uniref:hypothetical protein n=1 Tax=Streptomyces olivaceoviridis TaxID=1921 RepID=UPI003D9ED659